jgi:hypothetical protein
MPDHVLPPLVPPPHSPPRYQEETRKAIESINAVMAHLGGAAAELLTDTNKLVMLVVGGSALALGVYGAREGTRVAGKAVERWLGTPKLVRGAGGCVCVCSDVGHSKELCGGAFCPAL